MRRVHFPRLWRVLVAATAGSILLAGCSDAGASKEDPAPGGETKAFGILGDQPDGGTPVKGGSATYAVFTGVASLDPTVTQPTGATGGTEMAAVYDLLMRYDVNSRTYEPRLAESLEESPDSLTWTLKLREGTTFSDGTPLDAAAVVASIDRFNKRRGGNSQFYTSVVESTVATDPHTVTFTLRKPWRNFPAMLTSGHGMIVAPASDQGAQFTPIGAGPFRVSKFQPQQELELTARPEYWGGAPNLDRVRFVSIVGEHPKIEALRTNDVDMIYLRNAETVNATKTEFPGFVETTSLSLIGQVNAAPGRPGADPRVRQAIAYAIDPEILNTRASNGEALSGTDIFPPWSDWHSDKRGIQPDQAKARELLNQAMAAGYNGKIGFVSINDPEYQKLALAIQAQLNAVGFDTTIEYASSSTDMIKRRFVDRDFDLTSGAYSVSDVAPEIRLFGSLDSTSTNNIVGYASPQMDQLLTEVLTAPDDEAKRDAIGKVQELVNQDQPMVVWGSGATYIAWSPSLHDVTPSLDGIMLFDKAFVRK